MFWLTTRLCCHGRVLCGFEVYILRNWSPETGTIGIMQTKPHSTCKASRVFAKCAMKTACSGSHGKFRADPQQVPCKPLEVPAYIIQWRELRAPMCIQGGVMTVFAGGRESFHISSLSRP